MKRVSKSKMSGNKEIIPNDREIKRSHIKEIMRESFLSDKPCYREIKQTLCVQYILNTPQIILSDEQFGKFIDLLTLEQIILVEGINRENKDYMRN